MALFSKKNIKSNPFGLTEDDLKDDIYGFPMGVVVRMLEEQELQGNEPNVEVFQRSYVAGKSQEGFNWNKTVCGSLFWADVIRERKFDIFFEKYPEYEKYNLD